MTDSISLNPVNSENAEKSQDKNLKADLTGYAVAATVGAGAGLASAVVGAGIIDLVDGNDTETTDEITVDSPEQLVDDTADVAAQQVVQQPVAKPAQPHTPKPVQPAVEQNVQTPVGPTEPVIAEEQIDVHDIDEPDIINYDTVDTLYGPSGETFNVALVHDNAGNQLFLVDVNDDKVYDVITDTTLTPILEAPAGLTVADAEIAISNPEQYIAYNPEEHTEEFGLETLGEDLIC